MTDQPDTDQKELFDAVEVSTRTVPLDAVEPTPDTAPASLNNAIAALGLVSTPLLQLETESDEYGYRIVDGVRRVATLRDQGEEEVEAHVVGPEFEAEAAALTAVLNIVRDPAPLREAEKIADLTQDKGYTPESLSRIGIPQSKTKKRLRLWNAPEVIKDGVREGDVAVGTAEKVANLSPELQEECAEFYEEEGKLRHKDVTRIRQADREEQAEQMPDELFETPDVSREQDEDSGGKEPLEGTGGADKLTHGDVDVPTDADAFSDYVVIAGIVREYLDDDTWDPSPEDVAEEVVGAVGELGLTPEEGLALLATPPAHFLPDEVVCAINEEARG